MILRPGTPDELTAAIAQIAGLSASARDLIARISMPQVTLRYIAVMTFLSSDVGYAEA